MFQLDCSIQTYHWGKIGAESLVAKFKEKASEGFSIDQKKTYAELWMGSHPSGPSLIKSIGTEYDGSSLAEWLLKFPEMLGAKVREKFGDRLPFLLKVLSVGKALSIQAHPSKSHAEILHREHPDLYPDPNHKPEMAIALTPFEALCGFRLLSEIQEFLKVVPELTELLGTENVDDLMSADPGSFSAKEALKNSFTTLMNSSTSIYEPLLKSLTDRLNENLADKEPSLPLDIKILIIRLSTDFPNDIGIFGIFFFNYMKLQPGEAIFLAANEPHAYLSGDCVECMACSDNTVRAGLTPKHLDVPTLCSMLTYQMRSKEENLFHGEKEDEFTTIFKVPVPDFTIACIKLPAGIDSYELISRQSSSIFILVGGAGSIKGTTNQGTTSIAMVPGKVVFVSAGISASFVLSGEEILLFQAFVI